MSVITVERIKLFSTRSPWWCMIVAAVPDHRLSPR